MMYQLLCGAYTFIDALDKMDLLEVENIVHSEVTGHNHQFRETAIVGGIDCPC